MKKSIFALIFTIVASAEMIDSQFIVQEDISTATVAGIPLRDTWWSRPHEYAWAASFTGQELTVLDAACGISHPFKWLLTESCKETWGCDSDKRITQFNLILLETCQDLGTKALDVLASKEGIKSKINLAQASICSLPDTMPQFDRIFCISTLEHLDDLSRKQALSEFARKLASNGLLVMTVDCPAISPKILIQEAAAVGLVPAGQVNLDPPPPNALSSWGLSIYRCVFKHAS